MVYLPGVMNTANSLVGSGMLAMPFIVMKCGVILGPLLFLLCACVCEKACHMLVVLAKASQREAYDEIGKAVFGRPGQRACQFAMAMSMANGMVVWFVVLGDIIPRLADKYGLIDGVTQSSRAILMVLVAVCVVFPVSLQKNVMGSIAQLSKVSVAFYFCFMLWICRYGFRTVVEMEWIAFIPWFNVSGIPACIPIATAAMTAQTQFFLIYQTMPSNSVAEMRSCIQAACVLVWIVYTVVGLFGYAAVAGSVIPAEVTVLPNIMAHFTGVGWLSDVIQFGFAASIIMSYPLQVLPACDIIWSLYMPDQNRHHHDMEFGEASALKRQQMPDAYFVRATAALLCGSLTLAICVPRMDAIYMLSGATGNCTVAFFLPTICYLVWEDRYPRSVQNYALQHGFMLRQFAKLIFILGCFVSVSGLVKGCGILLSGPEDEAEPVTVSILALSDAGLRVRLSRMPFESLLHTLETHGVTSSALGALASADTPLAAALPLWKVYVDRNSARDGAPLHLLEPERDNAAISSTLLPPTPPAPAPPINFLYIPKVTNADASIKDMDDIDVLAGKGVQPGPAEQEDAHSAIEEEESATEAATEKRGEVKAAYTASASEPRSKLTLKQPLEPSPKLNLARDATDAQKTVSMARPVHSQERAQESAKGPSVPAVAPQPMRQPHFSNGSTSFSPTATQQPGISVVPHHEAGADTNVQRGAATADDKSVILKQLQLIVVVPEGAVAGQRIQFTSPSGDLYQVVVPQGATAGQHLTVAAAVPMDTADTGGKEDRQGVTEPDSQLQHKRDGTSTVTDSAGGWKHRTNQTHAAGPHSMLVDSQALELIVVVPNGAVGGQRIQFTSPSGHLYEVVIPDNAIAGQHLKVALARSTGGEGGDNDNVNGSPPAPPAAAAPSPAPFEPVATKPVATKPAVSKALLPPAPEPAAPEPAPPVKKAVVLEQKAVRAQALAEQEAAKLAAAEAESARLAAESYHAAEAQALAKKKLTAAAMEAARLKAEAHEAHDEEQAAAVKAAVPVSAESDALEISVVPAASAKPATAAVEVGKITMTSPATTPHPNISGHGGVKLMPLASQVASPISLPRPRIPSAVFPTTSTTRLTQATLPPPQPPPPPMPSPRARESTGGPVDDEM